MKIWNVRAAALLHVMGDGAGFRRRNSRRADHILDRLDASGPDSLFWFRYWCHAAPGSLLKDSVNELLEGAPVSLILMPTASLSREIPEVRNVHHVHVWMVGEKPVSATLHAQVIPPHDHDALLERNP